MVWSSVTEHHVNILSDRQLFKSVTRTVQVGRLSFFLVCFVCFLTETIKVKGLPGAMLLMWVTVTSFSSAARLTVALDQKSKCSTKL